jgi:uncharacterized integral membrane protein (TIGR00698 family)
MAWLRVRLRGIALALAVGLGAAAVGRAEEIVVGRAVLEPLVLAILLGIAVRALLPSFQAADAGVRFVAKEPLEVAVLLLGVTLDLPRLFAAGPALAAGIVTLVVATIALSLAIGRAVGLSPKLSILVACGNAICGNSAIAAVAPAIGAKREDVASSIALTAIIGVAMVVGLPMLVGPLDLTRYQFGVLAGLTVYAVPQVLAAAFAVSAYSAQVATAVKLARVLMLGPVVLFFSMRTAHGDRHVDRRAWELVPWFVAGFVVLAVLRGLGFVSGEVAGAATTAARWLTILAMAGLGLSVDAAAVRRAGIRVVVTVSLSLLALLGFAILFIRFLGPR